MKHIFSNSNESAVARNSYRCATLALPLRKVFFTLSLLLTISVGQMWGGSEGSNWYDASSAKVYFDNTNSSYSNVSILIGRQWNYGGDGVGSSGTNLSKISGTNNLYYASVSFTKYTTFCFIDATGWGWEDNKVTARCGYASHYTNTPNDNLSNTTHLYVPASGSNNASVTHTTPSSYTALNYTQTLNQTLSTDGGSTFSASTAAIATVKVQSKKLNGNSSTTDDSGTISSGSSSTSCAAARTATVTYSVASVATGYEFVGWYDGSTQKSTSTTYTYNALEAKTITARFKETQYSLTFSHNGHGTIAVGGATVASGSTANVNYTTTKTLVATPSTGYNFSGWTKSGSNTGSVTIGNASNASTTIKATNTGATITAGFTPKTTTITLNNQDATTAGTTEVTATYDAAMPAITLPTKTGYTFGGYWGAPNGSGPKYYNADGSSAATWNNENSTYTLFAAWTEITHDVRVATNTHATTSPNSWTAFGEVTGGTVSATSISTGYRFNGWSSDKGGTFADASSATTTFYPTTNDTYVTASIVAKTYSVTLDKNGGDSNGSATATYASSTISSFTGASRAGYSTDGYYTDPSAGVKILNSDGTLVTYSASVSSYINTSDQWKYDNNITLYPHWEVNATYYTLHYTHGTGFSTYFSSISATKTSGGDAIADNASLVSGTGVTITATLADHYRFVGWYSAAGCAANTLVSTDNPYSFSMSDNTNLYAKAELMTTVITFNKNGGSGSTPSTLTATHGSSSLSSGYVAPTRTGYTLQGWYTEESGGTRILFKGGTTPASVSGYTDGSGNWIYTGSTLTLYAHWTANTYKVTFDKQSGAGGSDNVTATYNAAMPSATMPTRTGYDFNGYFGSTGGSGTKYYNADGSSAHVWDVASATTIYAYWTIKNYTITYSPSSAPTGCTYTTKPTNANYNSTVTMVITPSTGYSVSVSARDASSNVVAISNPSANTYTFTQPASAVTVTVTATETMSTLTTSNHYDAGDPSYAAPSVSGSATTVGYSTTRTITATAAGTGYTFTGWTLTNCTRTDGGAATATSITIRSNGDGAAATVVANYEEVLTTVWYLTGSMNSWSTTANKFTKHSGESTGSVAYTTISLSANTTYQFGVNNGSDYYANNNGSSEEYYIKGTVENWVFNKDLGYGVNCYMKSSLAGTYTFKIDYSGSDPKISVYYPEIYAISGDFNSWTEETNLVFSGNDGSYEVSIDGSSTNYEFKVLDNGSWYGHTNKTFTGTESNVTLTTPNNNIKLTADVYPGGTYTFAYNKSTHKLGVTYPANFVVNFGKRTGGNTVTAKINNVTSFNDGTKIASGTSVTFSQTANAGYTFEGWYNAASGGTRVSTSASYTTTISAATTVYSNYTANNYTVTLDVDEDHKGTIAGATTSQTVTYNAATETVPNRPTAEQGYGLDGYYTGHNGAGTKLINGDGTWVASVAGYTDASSHWIHDGDETLYAYYKKAEITVGLAAAVVAPWTEESPSTVTATPTLSPRPEGDTKICWFLLQNNNNPVEPQPSFTPGEGNSVSFPAPTVSGNYKVVATLRTGSSCDGGTLLDADTVVFTVAGEHTVTIMYKCGDDVIKASTTSPGKPLEGTSITAPDIIGYSFHHWVLGDGVTLASGTAGSAGSAGTTTISYTAIYDGHITAVYTKKRLIYFNNRLGWSNVYVYFYKNANYWDNSNGTGSSTSSYSSSYTGIHGQMLPVSEGSQIYYFDAEAAGVNASYQDVAFTELEQTNYNYFAKTGTVKNKVIRRGDYKATTLPMFVPLAGVPAVNKNGNLADYYNEGYWMNYPENTGYVLKIYNSKTYGTSDEMQSIPFEFTANKTMPMSLTVELNANREYGFEIHRADGTTYGNNTKVMKINDSGDSGSPWAATSGKRTGIQTSVAGEYIFTLSFGNNGGYNYLVGVHYPVAVNDYRIVYKDLATWSQQEAHDASWHHPSRAIHKADGAQDTVSFYVSKAAGANASMKFQYASNITGEGVVTWSDVASGTIDLSSIENSGVYNFILTQAAGAISVEKIESYTGDYYIRTDCAGASKWENYRAADHQMTYSEFSKNRVTNTFGELFSHYFTKWCPRGMNVKFCIANDYSSCISDTLIQDADNFYNNIYEGDGIRPDGELKAQSYDGSGNITSTETDDRYSANIRFMYNEATNKISRAYIGSSTNEARKFLVLRGNATVKDEAGANLNEQGITNGLILHDDQNWIYERIIQIDPGTRFKLFACYAEVTPSEENAQYFRGSYDDNNFTTNTNSIILIDGDPESDFQKARIIYDFKTNRLVAAWMPSGSDISGTQAINADVMVVREHQNAAQTITFANNGKLSDVKTVYGAMKFNRWILNNRQHPEDVNPDHCRADHLEADLTQYHNVLNPGEQKSIYERSLYFISFPFNVKVSEIFGFGKYWDEWYIEYYDGLSRAKNGYWKDSPPNWKYVTKEMADTYVLEANKGYILGLDLDFMQAENTTFWANGISTVELYFPSQATVGSIQSTAVTMPALGDEYLCTINRGTTEGDRRVKDSYWRCIGVPGYSNYSNILTDEESATITWQPEGNTFPFLYEWNMTDNTLTAQSTNRYNFKAMHAYLVQNGNEIHWSAISATPVSPIVARERAASKSEYMWRLTMECDGEEEDQAFIRMTDEEDVTDGFDFGQDLAKEYNNARSDIYTYIGYERAAANSMPLHTDETTTIPVGVSIEKAGEYTFAMPDGTSGVGITLVDSETGARTNLSAGFTYTVNFEKGDYNNRLYLEISPVSQISTGVGAVSDQSSEIRKVVIDGLLYIVKDGQMYDATGKHCK